MRKIMQSLFIWEYVLSLGKYVSFVFFDGTDDVVSDWYVVAQAELIVDCAPWHCLAFLNELEHLECLPCKFVLADQLSWLEKSLGHALLCRA